MSKNFADLATFKISHVVITWKYNDWGCFCLVLFGFVCFFSAFWKQASDNRLMKEDD